MGHRGGLGMGRPKRRLGGTDYCVCQNCGYRTRHIRGKPCINMKCPRCGTPLAGSW